MTRPSVDPPPEPTPSSSHRRPEASSPPVPPSTAASGTPPPFADAPSTPTGSPAAEERDVRHPMFLAALGALVVASVVLSMVLVLWRWQLRAYPEWVVRQAVPAEEYPAPAEESPWPTDGGSEATEGPSGPQPEPGSAPLPGSEPATPPPSASTDAFAPLRPRVARARLAIVIDDWGYDWRAADAFFSLDAPLTVAVIPFLPHSRDQALEARRRGFEVLVHLPMQPQDPSLDPGPNAITTDLPDDEIRRRVELAIEAVPNAVGVNNHMGSRATADRRVMEQVLATVARRGLFFLDSHTTPNSVVGEVAREIGVPWAQNNLFLDGVRDVEAVRRRLELGVRRAMEQGQAIVIGHVQPVTAAAVASILPELRRQGIEVVPVSELLQR